MGIENIKRIFLMAFLTVIAATSVVPNRAAVVKAEAAPISEPPHAAPNPRQRLIRVLETSSPQGWQVFDQVKEFGPENLFRQIDGRAEFYLAYQARTLTFAGYTERQGTAEGQFIDVSVYDMGKVTNAFGVFSVERPQDMSPLSLGRGAYRSEANYFVWKGQYYIRVISSEGSKRLQGAAEILAQRVAKSLPDSGEPVWGLTAFPVSHRVPYSIQYYLVDALGLDFMRETYTAKYQKGNLMVTTFLSKKPTIEAARKTMLQYVKYAKEFGEGIERLSLKNGPLTLCRMDENYDVIFRKGGIVGGVSAAPDRKTAVSTAAELQFHLGRTHSEIDISGREF